MLLWAGFGGLLAIIVFTAWKGARVLSGVEPENARLHRHYREQVELLHRIRIELAESAGEVRDFLTERNPASAARRRSRIESLHRSTMEAIAGYRPEVPASGMPLWKEFEAGIDRYWAVLEPALGWDTETRLRRSQEFLDGEIRPRQREIAKLAAGIHDVEEQQSQEMDRRMALLFEQFRRDLILSASLAVAVGLILAFATARRLLDLERASDNRLHEIQRARVELQSLSQRLVAAQEDERRRVARELHDEVGQAISAVLVELGRLESRLPADDPAGNRTLVTLVRELAERAVAQVRDMALLLRPSMLDDLGLVPALKWQAREVSRRTGVKVKVAADDVPDNLPDDARTCIYRVVQEALNNAAVHAKASSVRVDVRQEEDGIRVAIQDDGSGFDPSQERGMGILGMEERVKNLGGVFRIDSEKGGGTIVSLLLPLPKSVFGGASA
jgi:signal transduction histidine kinase